MISLVIAANILAGQDADFMSAVALWQEFRMPVPSRKASFVLVKRIGSKDQRYSPALLDNRDGGHKSLYIGGYQIDPAGYLVSEQKWSSLFDSFAQVEAPTNYFTENALVSTAVQAIQIGHSEFANATISQISVVPDWRKSSWIGIPKDGTLTSQCGFLIATHLVNEYLESRAPTSEVIRKLKLLDEYGLVVPGPYAHPRGLSAVINDFEATEKPSASPAGSSQRVVDDLVNYPGPQVTRYEIRLQKLSVLPASVSRLGLDAVVPLANELEKHRLTRIFRSDYAKIVSVEEIARDLLLEIAKGDLGDWTDKETALAWLEAKKAGRVDAWLLGNLTNRRDKSVDQENFLRAIATRHSYLLDEAAQIVKMDRQGIASMGDIVEMTNWSSARKRDLIVEVTDIDDLEWGASSLQVVHKYSQEAFNRLMLKLLAQANSEKSYYIQEIFPYLHGTDNPEVWARATQVIRNAEQRSRMTMIEYVRVYPQYLVKRPNMQRVLDLFRSFFDDSTAISRRVMAFDGPELYTLPEIVSVGKVAIANAAYLTNIYRGNFQKLSETDWLKIRRKIEINDFRTFVP